MPLLRFGLSQNVSGNKAFERARLQPRRIPLLNMNARAQRAALLGSEPVTAVRHPPACKADRNGGKQRPPERQNGVGSIASASAGDVVFVESAKHLDAALQSRAAAVIAGSFADGVHTSKVLLIAEHPRLAFARAAAMLRDSDGAAVVHPTAFIHQSAQLGSVSIGARAS